MTDFSLLICEWYRRNKRELPWRDTKDPYKIWLSEIILQQTRVDQGKSYYLKFIKHYPTIKDLAMASEQEVLNDWQGLGYYSRARNLHKAAKIIFQDFNNVFPADYKSILKLPGIGPYTAAAISSFAYNEAQAVVDGNVFRVLARVFDIDTDIMSSKGKKDFDELAKELLPSDNPGEHNQALMEFGALHCTFHQAKCDSCVLQGKCLAFQHKTVSSRPVKIKKNSSKNRYFNYFHLEKDNMLLLNKRLDKDIWQHLYEFPMIESEKELNEQDLSALCEGKFKAQMRQHLRLKKHILSHQNIHATFILVESEQLDLNDYETYTKVDRSNLSVYPFSRLMEKYLEEN